MAAPLLRRPSLLSSAATSPLHSQSRHASLIRRPKRPYTFTQMITLSDGSTFLHRTTSPQPIYRSTKDTKNSPLWNPSSQKLASVEEDEAGRLKRFRGRFGRGWDAEGRDEEVDEAGEGEVKKEKAGKKQQDGEQSLMDLISGYGQEEGKAESAGAKNESAKTAKAKGGKK
ncbi:hypothetical protein B0A48_12708 [Cryoendolithus antarcticus]|uniref:Ribosomal protein bL31m N-terminal domain-containing protein n=1 Tax=Cryoendolithus antarcticus TaxID=1507870 RepID=A0A1V8SRP3_9PEZI|nr:hypothetical protein B0A48_12708 [Cryoendolithus antarcticus]